MRRVGMLLTVVALGLFASETFAEDGPGGGRRGGVGGAGGPGGGPGGAGGPGGRGGGPGGRGGAGGGPGGGAGGRGGPGGGPGQMDPQKMAAQMIQNFDKDGDKALNVRELAAAFKAMQQRRGQGGGPGAGGPGGRGGGPGGGAGGPGGRGGGFGGGDRPKRPE